MRSHAGLPVVLVTILAGCCTNLAVAQSAGTLQPDVYRMNTGQQVTLHWQTLGQNGLTTGTWPNKVDWLFVRGLGTQANLEDTQAGPDGFRVQLDDPGATVIGLDQGGTPLEIPSATLASFARQNVTTGSTIVAQLPTTADQPVTVRQFVSSKLIVRVAQPGGVTHASSAAAQSKTGQRAEIRAFADPSLLNAGDDLPLRTYKRGSKLAHARIQARNETTGETHAFTTDASGIGNLPIRSAGVWLVTWHHLEPNPTPDIDWDLYSATLRFEVQGGAE